MANEKPNTTPSQAELDKQLGGLGKYNYLAEVEQDTTAINMAMPPEKTLQLQGYQARPTEMPFDSEIDSSLYYGFLDQSLREDGADNIANDIIHHPTSGHRPVLPGDIPARDFHPLAEGVREHWKRTREDVSLSAVRGTVDGVSFWQETAARVIGSTPAQLAMGGMEPLARAQQVLYGAMAGEGWAAWSRLFPSVVLENEVDENGVPIETSPWAATIDAVWSKMRGDDQQYTEDIDRLRKVNAAYLNADLMEFSDVMDARIGADNMDEFYANLDDSGFMGKVAMGAVATGYAAGEIFVDPLIVFDFLPTTITKGAKALSSPATQAYKTAQVARKTRRLPDVVEARDKAAALLNKAHAEHVHAPSDATTANLKNAMNLFAEREDELAWFSRQPLDEGGDQFDMINLTNPGKRNPSTIDTQVVEEARGIVKGAGTSWERGIKFDRDRGLEIDGIFLNDPERRFRARMSHQIFIDSVGRQKGHPNNGVLDSIEMMADRLGVRVLPFESSGYKGAPLKLNGQYWSGSRTIALNMTADDPMAIMQTFLHETWHHVFHSYMTSSGKQDLIVNLANAGFDIKKYASVAEGLDYNFSLLGAADEFTARSLSEMSMDPKFWDTLRRMDPEAFEKLAKSAEDLAIMSIPYVDTMGGHTPSKWLGHPVQISDVATATPTRAAVDTAWQDHQLRVMKAIDFAYKQDDKLLTLQRERITADVRTVANDMMVNRDELHAQGKATPLLDKEIERAEKYIARLERGGSSAKLNDYKWKKESLRRRTVDEVAAMVAEERRSAAIRSTEAIQPNRQPTWGVDKDGNDVLGNYEQMDLFDDPSPLADEVADRLANGPDDAEYAAEGLARLVHGADADDVAARLNNIPERQAVTGGRIVPGTKRNMIDIDAARETVFQMKRNAKSMNMELWEYDSGAAFLNQALNDLKKADAPKRTKVKKGKQTLQELQAGTPKKLKKSREQPYDEGWLPKVDKRKAEQKMNDEWWNNHQANAFDRIASGLYPHTWRVKWPAMLRSTIFHVREPMRGLEDMDPGKAWPIIRGALFNAENETTRLTSVFNGAMERFGAVKVKQPTGLAKVLKSGQREKLAVDAHMSERLFDILDMSPDDSNYGSLLADLNPEQRAAVADIRHELNLIADRLGISGTDKFIDGYIHHAFDPALFAKGGMPPEHAGMSRSGNIFLGALLKRNGNKGFKKDAVGALEVYARGVGRKIHMEPALQQLRQRAMWHAKMDPRNKVMLAYTDMVIAQLRGEPSLMGSLVDKVAGSVAATTNTPYKPGAMARKVSTMTNLIYSSLLAGNRRYPIMSIATALVTTGAKFGMFRTVRGMFKMATPEGQLLFKRMGGDKQFKRIFESDLLSNKLNELTGAMTDIRPLSMSTTDTESFIRGMTFWASIDESLTKLGFSDIRMADEQGFMSEVLWEAMRTTEEINHFFGAASKPPAFSRISKTGAVAGSQFLSFPFKQSETLLGLFKDDPGQIARFMMLSGWVGRVGAQELGIDLQEYVGITSSVPKPYDMESPGVALLASMARMMGTMSALGEGYASAEDAKQSVDEFLKAGEVAMPGLRLAREVAQAAEMDVTGRKETPGLGFGRDVDVEYVNIGDRISIPLPSGPKGQRSEMLGVGIGARTIEETLHQRAKARVRQVINQAAVERMALVSKAKQAMDTGDWQEARKQMQRMAEMGMPIGDLSNPIKTKQQIDILDWHITEMKRNPKLAHKIIPILQEYGILGASDAER